MLMHRGVAPGAGRRDEWRGRRRGGGVAVEFPKFEAEKAIAVASLLPIDRDEYMRAEEGVGLEYLECRRRTWL